MCGPPRLPGSGGGCHRQPDEAEPTAALLYDQALLLGCLLEDPSGYTDLVRLMH